MYKKLHKEETRPHGEPFSQEGSLFWCVPERDIMLTKIEYDIQRKKRKTPGPDTRSFFSNVSRY